MKTHHDHLCMCPKCNAKASTLAAERFGIETMQDGEWVPVSEVEYGYDERPSPILGIIAAMFYGFFLGVFVMLIAKGF